MTEALRDFSPAERPSPTRSTPSARRGEDKSDIPDGDFSQALQDVEAASAPTSPDKPSDTSQSPEPDTSNAGTNTNETTAEAGEDTDAPASALASAPASTPAAAKTLEPAIAPNRTVDPVPSVGSVPELTVSAKPVAPLIPQAQPEKVVNTSSKTVADVPGPQPTPTSNATVAPTTAPVDPARLAPVEAVRLAIEPIRVELASTTRPALGQAFSQAAPGANADISALQRVSTGTIADTGAVSLQARVSVQPQTGNAASTLPEQFRAAGDSQVPVLKSANPLLPQPVAEPVQTQTPATASTAMPAPSQAQAITAAAPSQPGFAQQLSMAQTPQPAQQLGLSIVRGMREGLDRIDIQLHPAELGRVEVRMELGHDGRLQAVVSAEKSETLEQLRRDIEQLERALADAGFDLAGGGFRFDQGDRDEAAPGETAATANSDSDLPVLPAALTAASLPTATRLGIDISV